MGWVSIRGWPEQLDERGDAARVSDGLPKVIIGGEGPERARHVPVHIRVTHEKQPDERRHAARFGDRDLVGLILGGHGPYGTRHLAAHSPICIGLGSLGSTLSK